MVPKPARSVQSLKKKGIPQLAVPHLRVKKSQTFEINPCQDLMSAMLGRSIPTKSASVMDIDLVQDAGRHLDMQQLVV
jgi:hypothetical protein